MPDEAATVAHKYVMATSDKLHKPVDEQTLQVGHVHLNVEEDGAMCKHIADSTYDLHTGARSLRRGVHECIAMPVTELYLDTPGEISPAEMNVQPMPQYTARLQPTGDGNEEVNVFIDGQIEIQKDELGELVDQMDDITI